MVRPFPPLPPRAGADLALTIFPSLLSFHPFALLLPRLQVQKSQARIKQVLSERRHAALEAAAILRAGGEVDKAEALEKVAEEGAALV